MTWFQQQRQDFIRAQLEAFGMIRRQQIVDKFEVTIQVASADIQQFLSEHPDLIDYDRSAKCYTLDKYSLAKDPAP